MDKEWEAAFTVWATGPGKTEQDKCENAERGIRAALDTHPELANWNLTVQPHGSYNVNTNVKTDSDVDIYVRVNYADFYDDYPPGKTRGDFGNRDGSFDYPGFRGRVERALKARFGEDAVTPGDKAFDVHENNYRVDADVSAVLPYRWYTGLFNPDRTHHYYEGISFHAADGTKVRSFPEQTYANGVAKNDATSRRYKRAIRILKNLRNYMVDDYNVAEAKGIASFLIECLLWNVPNDRFGNGPYWHDIYRALAFLKAQTVSPDTCREWAEVNYIRHLWDSDQLWTLGQARAFVNAAWNFLEFE